MCDYNSAPQYIEMLRERKNLKNIKIEASIDSGASHSLIHENIYKQITFTGPLDLGVQVNLYDVQSRKFPC